MAYKIRAFSASIIDQGIVSGANFLIGILLVRRLGLDIYSDYVLMLIVVAFCQTMQSAIILTPMLSIYPKIDNIEKKQYIAFVSFANVFMIIFVCCLMLILYDFVIEYCGRFVGIGYGVMLVYFALILSHDYLRRVLFLVDRVRVVLLADVLLYAGQLFFIYMFIDRGMNSQNLFLYLSFPGILSFILIISLLNIRMLRCEDIKKYAIRHWISSRWLVGSGLMYWFSGNYFLTLTPGILGQEAVGSIKIAQNLFGIINVMLQSLENIFPRHYSELIKCRRRGILRLLVTHFTFTVIFLSFMLLIIVYFRVGILNLLYGDVDSSVVTIFPYIALMTLIMGCSMPFRYYLRAIEKTAAFFWAYVPASLLSVVFGRIVIEGYGIYGVGWCYVCVQTVLFLVVLFFSAKYLNEEIYS